MEHKTGNVQVGEEIEMFQGKGTWKKKPYCIFEMLREETEKLGGKMEWNCRRRNRRLETFKWEKKLEMFKWKGTRET